MTQRQLYLDCDGVLADFEHAARAILGSSPKSYLHQHGPAAFWRQLERAPDFYARLPLMPGATELFEAVRHLDPVILTGLPRGEWAADQKVRWAKEHFPGTRIITCMAVDKRVHCKPGDVLVDDTVRHRHLWEHAGCVFVLHRNAEETLDRLEQYFPIARPAEPRARQPAVRWRHSAGATPTHFLKARLNAASDS